MDTVRRSGATLDTIVVVDAQPSAQQSGTLTLEQMKSSAAADFDFESTWRAVKPNDVATLIYTSGTTGNPKGVETTHACLLFETTAVSAVLPVEFGDRITSYMPSAHIADRLTCLYMQMVFGTQITVVPDPSQVAAALPDCRPTIWGSVPRVWEKLKVAVESGRRQRTRTTRGERHCSGHSTSVALGSHTCEPVKQSPPNWKRTTPEPMQWSSPLCVRNSVLPN